MNVEVFHISGRSFHLQPEIPRTVLATYILDAQRTNIPQSFPEAEDYVMIHPRGDDWDERDAAEQLLGKRFSTIFEAKYALCYARGTAYMQRQWTLAEEKVLWMAQYDRTLSSDPTYPQILRSINHITRELSFVEPRVVDCVKELTALEKISCGDLPSFGDRVSQKIGILTGTIPFASTLRDIRLYVKTYFSPDKKSHFGRIELLAHQAA